MGNSASKDKTVKTTLFKQEPNGTTYRIPALIYLKHCGTFLAFAEKRSAHGDNDAKILVMRRGTLEDDGSVQWSPSQELSTACLPDHRTMNPCPVYEKNTKTLFLFFICVFGQTPEWEQIKWGESKAHLCFISSSDDGKTWSQVTDLTESVIGEKIHDWATFAVGPGHGVQLENGRLIIPAYAYYIACRGCCFPKSGSVHPYSFAFYSEDFGQTWCIGKMLQESSGECQMAEIIDHEGRSHLYCNARTKRNRIEALSEDSGGNFDKIYPTSKLIEQDCQGSIISFPAHEFVPNDTQTWLLFLHPTSKSSRQKMGVYLNQTPPDSSGWEKPRIIHRGPSGYSDLAYTGDKHQFSCLMECGRFSEVEKIVFMSFTLSDVMQTGSKKEKKTH